MKEVELMVLNLFMLQLVNCNYLFCNIFLLIIIFLMTRFHDNIRHSYFSASNIPIKIIFLERGKNSLLNDIKIAWIRKTFREKYLFETSNLFLLGHSVLVHAQLLLLTVNKRPVILFITDKKTWRLHTIPLYLNERPL